MTLRASALAAFQSPLLSGVSQLDLFSELKIIWEALALTQSTQSCSVHADQHVHDVSWWYFISRAGGYEDSSILLLQLGISTTMYRTILYSPTELHD